MNENNTQNVIPNVDSKSKQERNVPDLRFPIYQNFPLTKTNFGNIATYKKGPFGSSLKKEIFVPKGIDTIKVYEQQNAIEHDHTLERYFISYDYYLKMKSFTVKAGDIIVSCAGTIGEVYTLPSNAEIGVINQALMKINPNYSIVDHNYFIYSFEKMINSFSDKYSNGSVIKNIPPFSDLKKYPINLPILSEQKFIANFIETLNMRIDTQKKIIEDLLYLKNEIRNVMILSAERIGEVYTLKELALYFNGVAHEKNISEDGLILVNSKFISSDGIIKKHVDKSQFILNKNDICFVLSDLPNGKALSKCFYIDENNKYALNQRIACIRSQDDILSKYLYYYLSRNKYFLRFDDGVSQTNLKKDEVLNCPIYYNIRLNPFIIELELIDDKISNEKKILSLYEKQKQYLLNKLFI